MGFSKNIAEFFVTLGTPNSSKGRRDVNSQNSYLLNYNELLMPFNQKKKELTAVGISVAAGCRPCTDYHLGKVAEAGATPDEIRQALADALCVKRNATDLIEVQVLSHSNDTPSIASDCGN